MLSRRILWITSAICFIALLTTAPILNGRGTRAESDTITAPEFRSRLERTNTALLNVINNAADRASLQTVLALWDGIEQVVLSDNTKIHVDLNWLTNPLRKAVVTNSTVSNSDLQELDTQIQAMLKYCDQNNCSVDKMNGELVSLQRILQDPRFTYPDPTSTPRPPQPDNSPGPDLSFLSQLANVVLVVGGIGGALALLVYIGRDLMVQKADAPDVAQEGDPTTSDAAVARAVDSKDAQDYRNAIRYLYLSSLLLLDERGVMKYEPTLTNREHLQRVAHQPQLNAALRPVVNTFDQVWYGFATVNETMYEEFRRNVEQLRHITPTTRE